MKVGERNCVRKEREMTRDERKKIKDRVSRLYLGDLVYRFLLSSVALCHSRKTPNFKRDVRRVGKVENWSLNEAEGGGYVTRGSKKKNPRVGRY